MLLNVLATILIHSNTLQTDSITISGKYTLTDGHPVTGAQIAVFLHGENGQRVNAGIIGVTDSIGKFSITVPGELPTQVDDNTNFSDFKISYPYPNPFHSGTAIDYTLRKASDVKIHIYSITGKLIFHTETKTQPAGQHTFTWSRTDFSGQSVAAGVYFISLIVEDKRVGSIVTTALDAQGNANRSFEYGSPAKMAASPLHKTVQAEANVKQIELLFKHPHWLTPDETLFYEFGENYKELQVPENPQATVYLYDGFKIFPVPETAIFYKLGKNDSEQPDDIRQVGKTNADGSAAIHVRNLSGDLPADTLFVTYEDSSGAVRWAGRPVRHRSDSNINEPIGLQIISFEGVPPDVYEAIQIRLNKNIRNANNQVHTFTPDKGDTITVNYVNAIDSILVGHGTAWAPYNNTIALIPAVESYNRWVAMINDSLKPGERVPYLQMPGPETMVNIPVIESGDEEAFYSHFGKTGELIVDGEVLRPGLLWRVSKHETKSLNAAIARDGNKVYPVISTHALNVTVGSQTAEIYGNGIPGGGDIDSRDVPFFKDMPIDNDPSSIKHPDLVTTYNFNGIQMPKAVMIMGILQGINYLHDGKIIQHDYAGPQ